jgi:hypothetical protein
MGLEGFKFSPSPQSYPSARERRFKTLALFKGEGRVRVCNGSMFVQSIGYYKITENNVKLIYIIILSYIGPYMAVELICRSDKYNWSIPNLFKEMT